MATHLCQCNLCATSTTIHQVTGEQVIGLYVSRFTYNRHNARRPQGSATNEPTHTVREAEELLASPAQSESPGVGSLAQADTYILPQGQSLASGRETDADDHRTSGPSQEIEEILADLETRLQEFRLKKDAFERNLPPINFDVDSSPSPSPPELRYRLNKEFLLHRHSITDFLDYMDEINLPRYEFLRARRKEATPEVLKHLDTLDTWVEDSWERFKLEQQRLANAASKEQSGIEVVDCEEYFTANQRMERLPAAFLASIMTVIILHLIPGLAEADSNFLLGALRIIITTACISYVRSCSKDQEATPLPDPVKTINGDQPWFSDVRTAMKTLQLEPSLISYACCKQCFSCYSATDGLYPAYCTYRETLNSIECGTKLLTIDEDGKGTPIQTFQYQPITSFIARLLSRPGISTQMKAVSSNWNSRLVRCWDIFGAAFLRTFLGPDAITPFLQNVNGEERLVFTLFVDWFNPFGNKIAGKKRSIGGLYMVCLNLPIHLRYLPENVYVAGLLPGEPCLHHINNILRPLIADLRKLWEPGVWFTKTSAYLTGCLVQVAALPLVADGPGSRKAAGFAAMTAKFFCILCRQTKDQIANFDIHSWTAWDRETHSAVATEWNSFTEEAARDEHFNIYQIRWSELMRLPYWDMTKLVIVDPMHTLFLNVVQQHVRNFFGQNETEIHGRQGVRPHTPEEQAQNIQMAVSALDRQDITAMKKLRRTYLDVLASENSVPLTAEESSSKIRLASALIEWRSALPPGYTIKIPNAHSEPAADIERARNPRNILDKFTIGQIRIDMGKLVLPGWIDRAPKNFASVSHGKMSADHWRTAVTINLVITLVRLWGHPNSSRTKREMLDNFIFLVTALVYATSRTMCEEYIQIVETHLQLYYTSLVNTFGTSKLHPSHHTSLHIPQCLRLFGPVHGWWAYPYERYNGIIQRLNHNSKYNQMTTTLLKKFCQAANLKSLLGEDSGIIAVIHQLKTLFKKHYKTEFHGSLLSDVLGSQSPQEVEVTAPKPITPDGTLNPSISQLLATRINQESRPLTFTTAFEPARLPNHALLSPEVQDYHLIHAKGVVFATAARSIANSHIIFHPDSTAPTRAGQIHRIFAHTRPSPNGDPVTEYFLSVKQFTPLDHLEAAADPYRKYPLLDVKLYEDRLLPSASVIKLTDVVAHFGTCIFDTGDYDKVGFNRLVASEAPAQNLNTLPGLDMQKRYRVVLSLDRNLRTSRVENNGSRVSSNL